MSDKRIVLLGKTGSGKSTLGNSLLRQVVFKSASSAVSITKVCEKGERRLSNGANLKVVDTPGLYDTDVSNEERVSELAQSLKLCRPGVHAFLLVLKIGRFTEEELATVTNLQEMFGEEILDYIIIVFTGKDSLNYDGIDLDEYLKHIPGSLKTLIKQCGNRVAAINNRSSESDRDADVNYLLNMVEKKIKRYGSDHLFTEAMYRVDRQRERELQLEILQKQLAVLKAQSQRYESCRHNDSDCTIL